MLTTNPEALRRHSPKQERRDELDKEGPKMWASESGDGGDR